MGKGIEIDKSRITRLRELHGQIVGALKMTLPLAIEAGGILAEVKASLPHGDFIPWIEKNLPFTDRTARNYMRLYESRDKLKTETLSDLTSAYKLIEEPRKAPTRRTRIQDLFAHQPKVEIHPVGMGLTVLSPITRKEWSELMETAAMLREDAAAWIIGDLMNYAEKMEETTREAEDFLKQCDIPLSSVTEEMLTAWIRDCHKYGVERGWTLT